eukprot:10764433-Heterocapsa_arctica.AAC.1
MNPRSGTPKIPPLTKRLFSIEAGTNKMQLQGVRLFGSRNRCFYRAFHITRRNALLGGVY